MKDVFNVFNTPVRPHSFITSLLMSTAVCAALPVNAATMKEADTNGDGKLSLAEVKAAQLNELEVRFKEIDTDEDGLLSKSELKANR